MELKTRKLFADLIPPLSIEERGELENSIMDEGCRDAICVWNGVIVDGHNRYEICKRRKRAFRVKEMSFDNDEAAVAWIIRNQFGRRNLTAMQRAELALKLKDAIAAEAKKRQGARNDLKKNIPQKSAGSSKETRDELAKMAGVSHDTIAKVEKIIAGAEPEVVEATRKGEMSINKAYQTVAPTPAPKEPAPEPQDGFAIVADVDAPEGEERDTEPPRAVSVEAAPELVKRIKNWERFANWHEATEAFDRECGGVVIRCNWNGIGEWMYMDYIEGESRLAFLKRCGNLTAEGRKEITRLEKAEKKGATK
ncbi:MAG: hypothetical protein II265_03475 [Clostridia bacterium]|nr:hypothetical protein [Clostridia bacterium]